jgi:shikimate dehydrogenase
MRFLNNVEDNARKIGAVNTIVIERGKFIGYNTDIIGVRDALLVNGVDLRGKKAVVMGAGGAARAAIFALQTEGTDVVISNRTFEKAKKIAEALGCRASKMENLDGELENTDMLISCIPSTERMVNPHLLRKELVILDANYRGDAKL